MTPSTSRAARCSPRAINARLNGVRVTRRPRRPVRRGRRPSASTLIVSNPPYVPGEATSCRRAGASRAWDAGRDGRVLLDRICAEAAAHLRPGGTVLLVHSSVSGEERDAGALGAAGLQADVVERRRGPLGPAAVRARAGARGEGAARAGERTEEILVLAARASERLR